ncbi:pyridoxamine 5'-phosphate oxidase [Streptomyces albidoflavus]|uniref:pyridoxamine 5'-phosphate oxidase n=1 Tax=Streptomyces TaxID=1883 RepID=UPI000A77182B|nr:MULTISPECIES: pyridoxamine 5'-phosphate oxidase [Streptomyces]MBV7250392.1 pyridoxamine 5'-phosphate oxidase [Streptomyces sp. S-2]RZE29022.1 pyridoxamine 5'-phosphate oxidase [Streptomyces albidoflavus]
MTDAEGGPVRAASESLNPAAMRKQYRRDGLDVSALAAEPMEQFAHWFAEAARDGLYEPNAMIVSTAGADGAPDSRTVLLKQYDRRGFVFYTNHHSRKGTQLAENPQVALLFPWHPLARQVRVTGTAAQVPREETAAYFRTRPHGSQVGAWASDQSAVVPDRATLDRAYAELAARHSEGDQVPVPPHWGGYRVTPRTVEFWQGRENRLHDRLRYVRSGGEDWRVERLAP